MQKSELTFDVIEALKETADKFRPELFQQLWTELGVRDARLLDYVFGHYYQKGEMGGRWYDPYHILFSTHFAVQLVRSMSRSPLIIPAIILHDIGYRILTNEAKANWNTSQNRIIHMQEGAALSARILVQIGGFNALEIGTCVGMVASHDNIYLDILTEQDPNRLAVRDADRMWVMHFISFYKDWFSEPEKTSLTDLLKLRKDSICGDKGPSTDLAQEWLGKQFRMRSREISANIIRDKDTFQKYAAKHIRAELKAGRG